MSSRAFNWNPLRSHVQGDVQVASDPCGPVQAGAEAKPMPESTTWATAVTKVDSWPEEARPLKRHDWVSYLYLIGDLILVMLPVYFILLGVAAITLNGKATKDNAFGSKVEFAIQLGPTIFPIVFAAISGRSMKMIARFLAERGAKLSTLELLMASQSVWGTIESQLLMRRLTLVGANLLFLWAMSPLGGQASLRLLEKSSKSEHAFKTLRYLSTGPGAAGWAMETTIGENVEQIHPLFTAALLAPNKGKEGPEDTWGNVKIPRLESLNASSQTPDGWITVPRSGLRPEDYVSLAGIPVIGRPHNQDAEFNLETTQMILDCQPFLNGPVSVKNGTGVEKLAPIPDGVNLTADGALFSATTFFMIMGPRNENYESRVDAFSGRVNNSSVEQIFTKRNITYVSQLAPPLSLDTEQKVNAANCSVSQTHTETGVKCSKDGCSAVRIRKSLTDLRPKEVTALDHNAITTILDSFPKAFGKGSFGSTPTEQFIFNTSTFPFVLPTSDDSEERGWVDLSVLSGEAFSRRLGLLLNTYYQITLAPKAYMGGLPSNNMSLYGPDTLPVTDANVYLPANLSTINTTLTDWYIEFSRKIYGSGIAFIGATANATTTRTAETYKCNFAWLAALFAAAGIILATGAASLMLKHKTLGPEMFGFVASMTYENPHVKIPAGGTMLDAMERARLLKDIEVRVGDVNTKDEVGHIAFTAGVPLRRLERSRTYA